MSERFFVVLFCMLCKFGIAQEKSVQVVLLAGQSNMQGHGNYEELEPSLRERIEKISSRVYLSTTAKPSNSPRPLSYYSLKGENNKYKFTKHFGPELLIGLTLAEANPNKEFLLIKKAAGGTSLYGAWNPNWSKEKAGIAERGAKRKAMQLYQIHSTQIKNNLKLLGLEGRSYKVLGMVWMQGESDTNKEITASHYKENLESLIAKYRKDLRLNKMPFIIGQINVLPRNFKKGPAMVRQAMEEIAGSDSTVGIITTSTHKPWLDYPKHPDDLHYNTKGQKRLGIAFGELLMKLQKN